MDLNLTIFFVLQRHKHMLTKHTFTFHNSTGLSDEALQGHIGLYEKYVDEANSLTEKIRSGSVPLPERQELMRRFSFEYNGAKNHAYFFETLCGQARAIDESSELYKKITETWGSFDAWKDEFMTLAKTRGVGWAILWQDSETNDLYNAWVDEQHLGQLSGAQHILGIDCWEHSFITDFGISGRGKYLEAVFSALNFEVIEGRIK